MLAETNLQWHGELSRLCWQSNGSTHWPIWNYWQPDGHGQEADRRIATASSDLTVQTLYTNTKNQMPSYVATGDKAVAGGTRLHKPVQPPKNQTYDTGWCSAAAVFVYDAWHHDTPYRTRRRMVLHDG